MRNRPKERVWSREPGKRDIGIREREGEMIFREAEGMWDSQSGSWAGLTLGITDLAELAIGA